MLTGIVLCASLCVLASCSKNAQKMNVKQTIDAAKNMSHDELVAKAKEEAAAAKSRAQQRHLPNYTASTSKRRMSKTAKSIRNCRLKSAERSTARMSY